jgi:hypothetical protein
MNTKALHVRVVGLLLTGVVCGGVASGASLAASPAITPVSHLSAYQARSSVNSAQRPALLSGLIAVENTHLAQTPRTVQEAIGGANAVWLIAYPNGTLCAALLATGLGYSVSCRTDLGTVQGSVGVSRTEISGHSFVWGLATNEVSQVDIAADGRTTSVTPSDNAFLVSLPVGASSPLAQSVKVTAHYSNAQTATATLSASQG